MRLCKNTRSAEDSPAAMARDATPTGYIETYRRSLERPEEFWAETAEAIDWERRWDRVLEDSRPTPSLTLPRRRGRVREGAMVCGWAAQYLLECARPSCCGGPRRPHRPDLGQPGHRAD